MLRRVRRSTLARVAALAMGVLAYGVPVRAADDGDDWWVPYGFGTGTLQQETFAGSERLGSAVAFYAGSVYAPFGTIREDGWRMRATTAYGWYSYDGIARIGGRLQPYEFKAETIHSDAMIGYQWRLGPAMLKLYGGGAYDQHGGYAPAGLAGKAWGFKAAAETWLALGNSGFAQLDAAWTKAHEMHSSRLRLGYRLLPQLSVGPEAGYFGNAISEGVRKGGFLRFEWEWGEASASAGVGGDRDGDSKPYASLTVMIRH